MIIFGVILLLVAAGALWFARSERASARKVTATETLPCGDISTLSGSVADEVGAGSFRQRCEVVGKAEPGPAGLVKAPESGADVVWHSSKVTHRYWVMEERRSGDDVRRERVEKTETVSDQQSETPFVVRDQSGTVLVAPSGATVDGPEQVVDRFERASATESVAEGLLASFLRSGSDSGTVGFQHEEWVLRAGAQLYVHGEVADADGALTFAAPTDDGDFVVSTRSEADIVGDDKRNAAIALGVAVIAALAGVALVVAGVVA